MGKISTFSNQQGREAPIFRESRNKETDVEKDE